MSFPTNSNASPSQLKAPLNTERSKSADNSISDKIRILVTDDSPMYRRLIREVFLRYSDVEVVGSAYDGENCLELADQLNPNVITLDINMPRRDGLSTLEELRRRGNRAYVVMVSTPTTQSADQTLHALRKGALDMILKPMGSNLSANRKALEDQLAKQVETVRCLMLAAKIRKARNEKAGSSIPDSPPPHVVPNNLEHRLSPDPGIRSEKYPPGSGGHETIDIAARSAPQGTTSRIIEPQNDRGARFTPRPEDKNGSASTTSSFTSGTGAVSQRNREHGARSGAAQQVGLIGAFDVLCIGVSTGGPSALASVLPSLPSRIPVPIFIVQHMPPLFTKSLADHLNAQCRFPICEATDGTIVQPGVAYIAPGGKQMRLVKQGTQVLVQITDDSFVAAAKPSVDYLFNSVADIYGKKTLGIIMTGMGSDGLNGCKKLFSKGARILAQSEETCVVYGMPRQVIEHKVSTEIVPLQLMATRITELLRL